MASITDNYIGANKIFQLFPPKPLESLSSCTIEPGVLTSQKRTKGLGGPLCGSRRPAVALTLAFHPCPRSFQLYSTQNVRKNPRLPWHPRAAPRVTRLTPERLTRLPGMAVLTSQVTCCLTPAWSLPDDQGSRGHCQAPHPEGGSNRQIRWAGYYKGRASYF